MPFPTFDTKDAIPKGFESEYEERDGKWQAKVPDVSKLEDTLAKVRSEKKEAERLAREASDKFAETQRQLDAKNATGADTDKKVSEMLAKWEQDKNAAVKAVQDELDARTAELRGIKLDDKAMADFVAAGGRPEKAKAALTLKKPFLDLDGERIIVKNEKGEATTATVADFWGKTFKTEMPEFFTGTKAAGGGAVGGAGKGVQPAGAMSADDVIKNPLAALQAANEAAAA